MARLPDRLLQLLTPPLEQRLRNPATRLETRRQGTVLCLWIDRPEGVNLDDCLLVNRAIEPILNNEDPIRGAYRLEVSRPAWIVPCVPWRTISVFWESASRSCCKIVNKGTSAGLELCRLPMIRALCCRRNKDRYLRFRFKKFIRHTLTLYCSVDLSGADFLHFSLCEVAVAETTCSKSSLKSPRKRPWTVTS